MKHYYCGKYWSCCLGGSLHKLNQYHRVQRSEVRAERLVFLAKDNRHNLLRSCVTRVIQIFTAGQITVGS